MKTILTLLHILLVLFICVVFPYALPFLAVAYLVAILHKIK